jgi:threonine/homoserine/homoserine lactone efflux protein
MRPDLYSAFVVAATLLVLSPGPVNVTVMAHATQHGWRWAMLTNAGACLSLAVQLALMSIGVSSLLLVLGDGFELLRWLGAAYVVYLGIEQWRAPVPGNAAGDRSGSHTALFWQGFLVSSTNPKSLLLFPAFFPQFLASDRPALFQLAVLSLTFLVISLLGFAALAGLAHRLRPFLRGPGRERMRNRVFGGALVVLGLGLIIG